MKTLELIEATRWSSPSRRRPDDRWLVVGAVLTGGVVAWLVTIDRAPVVVAGALLLPTFVLVHRAPMAAIGIWLAVQPFLTSGFARPVFWAVHRALPLAVLAALILRRGLRMDGASAERPVRLGWPELMMAAYVVATTVSILYTSETPTANLIHLFDRVVVPMMLYMIVRLAHPTDAAVRHLAPLAVLLIATQSLAGVLQWVSPGALPSAWLGRAGERTTGTLGGPAVYGVALLAAGAIALHLATHASPVRRRFLQFACAWAFLAAVMSFTRAVWLATLLVIVVLAWPYPRLFVRLAVPATLVLAALVLSGAAASQLDRAEQRFQDSDTAMSRLPVMQASIRMFDAKPLTGWGYDNFELYDRDFQDVVNGFYPEKDQASHNLYLTLLAEQGIIGLGLYVGPVLVWLQRSGRAASRFPRRGVLDWKLLVILWAILGTHVVVNQFSNMQREYGLGLWWLSLGLIASLVSRVEDPSRTRQIRQ